MPGCAGGGAGSGVQGGQAALQQERQEATAACTNMNVVAMSQCKRSSRIFVIIIMVERNHHNYNQFLIREVILHNNTFINRAKSTFW